MMYVNNKVEVTFIIQDYHCNGGCDNNGVCVSNTCYCHPGYNGPHCKYVKLPITFLHSIGERQ